MADKCPAIAGQFSEFPSKGNKDPNDPQIKKDLDAFDPDDICNDGDQTTYNGLLCASGEDAGCRAVAQAQDSQGHWFRSPHRRWKWEHRCFDKTPGHQLSARKFNDECAYGFSPDMNLVFFYLPSKQASRSVMKNGSSGWT